MESIDAGMSINLKPLDLNNNTIPNTIFAYKFDFTTDSNCNNILLSISQNIQTIPDGTAFTSLDISSLTQQPTYLCIYRDSILTDKFTFDDLLLNSLRINNMTIKNLCFSNSQCYNATNSTQFTSSQGTLTILPSWLTSYINTFNYITNWLIPDTSNGYLYNDSTKIYFNATKNNLTIDSRINITVNNNNASWSSTFNTTYDNKVTDNSSWNESYANTKYSKYYPLILNMTTITYNGSLINGSYTGYLAGNQICNLTFNNSHFCTQDEVIKWQNIYNSTLYSGNDTWVISFGPKYIPATVPVNDCNAFTYDGTTSYLGNYYHFNSTYGGDFRAINCATKLPICCVSY